MGSLNGMKILDEDISGVYVEGEPAFSDFSNDFSTNLNDPVYKTGRFVVDDVQYCLTVKDDGKMEVGTFTDILDEAMDVVSEKVFGEQTHEMEGSYYDRYSSRATAQVTLMDDNELVVDITWSNSANEYEEWIMFVKYDGIKLNYDEAIHTTVTHTRDGEVTTPNDDYGAGYFEVIDGMLYWTGSGNELTDKCVFEKAD